MTHIHTADIGFDDVLELSALLNSVHRVFLCCRRPQLWLEIMLACEQPSQNTDGRHGRITVGTELRTCRANIIKLPPCPRNFSFSKVTR